jgi:hypothetical protein
MSNARASFQSTLSVAIIGASPQVFTPIAEVTTLGELGPETADIEVTHLTSADAYREYVAGAIEPGELTGVANYLHGEATQDLTTGLGYRQKQRTNYRWRIELSGVSPAEGLEFDGYVKSWKPNIGGIDDKPTLNFSIKITGPIDEF